MNKLWDFGDYVNHLNHKNGLVRRWALNALDNCFPNKYADQVAYLLNDEDEYIVCQVLRYLSRHQALHHAPAILERFQSSQGIVSSNSAVTLAKMGYEPAMDVILDKFINPGTEETFYGALSYLGKIRSDKCRAALHSALTQIKEPFLLGALMDNLLRHYDPEDVKLVMDVYFDPDNREGVLLKNILSPLEGDSYFTDLTEYGENLILSNPADTLDNLLFKNSQIEIDQSILDRLIQSLKNGHYEDFLTMIMFEARNIITNRYSKSDDTGHLKELSEQDTLCINLLEDLSKRSAVFKEAVESPTVGSDLIAFVLSIYFGIIERGAYVNAYHPDSSKADLIHALEKSGSSLPSKIQDKILELAPIPEMKEVLKNKLKNWGGIWAVRLMGRIGDKAFVPDLIYVLCNSDSLDYIYSDALFAINALHESADEVILNAIKDHELGDWESFPVLEYLPYSEAYDLAVERWEAESEDDMGSYEVFANCLKGIGDKKGIQTLQEIYVNENDSIPIGNALECLSEIHQQDIPELPEIRKSRKEHYERQKARERELNNLARNYKKQKEEQGQIEKPAGQVVPFKRNSPKVGRNDPCPCGSGKKYKKCCLNKDKS